MSGNIKDTNVDELRQQVQELTTELNTIKNNGEDIDSYKDILKTKYKYLVKTSDTLFNLILNQQGKENFMNNLNIMLNNIERIQKSQITQHDASCEIGETLASQFIPQLKK